MPAYSGRMVVDMKQKKANNILIPVAKPADIVVKSGSVTKPANITAKPEDIDIKSADIVGKLADIATKLASVKLTDTGVSGIKPTCTKCTAALWSSYHSGNIPIIPDIKCKSPEKGGLLMGRDPVMIAKKLKEAGAPVISVVTESEHYGGSPELLHQIAKATSIPILRKDFITTREQLLESVDIGASGVLLIAAILDKKQLFKLIEEALLLDLEPLVETHNETEINTVNELNLTFLGINNRSIVEWEMDGGNVSTTEKLAGLVHPGALILSESSINSPDDVMRAKVAGAHAVLVGTAILQAQNPVEVYNRLSGI